MRGQHPSALLALWALRTIGPASGTAQHLMTTTLGGALLLTAAATLYKAFVFSPARQAAERAARQSGANRPTAPATGACPCCWAR